MVYQPAAAIQFHFGHGRQQGLYLLRSSQLFSRPEISTLYAIDRLTGTIDYTIQNPNDVFTTYSSISSVALGTQQDALVINNSNYNGPKQVTSLDLSQQTVRWNRSLNAVNSLAVGAGTVVVPESLSLSAIGRIDRYRPVEMGRANRSDIVKQCCHDQ